MPNVDSTVMTPRGTEQEGLVRGHLEELLASEEFQRSPQLAGFLRYVVTEALAGRSDRLKGYNVAVSALGRDEDFDPGSDPIVRITAGRLRRALERHYLGGGADSAVQIRIPKGGYVPEFVFPDHVAESVSSTAAERPIDTSPSADDLRPRLAVLPFKVLGDDTTQAFFADGLTAELVVSLTQFPDLIVTSHHSTQAIRDREADIRETGRTLNVRFVLGGVVRRSGERFRVSATLGDARSGEQVWAKTLERDWTADDLFAVQDDIVGNVIRGVADLYHGSINLRLTSESRRKNPATLTAYEAVLWQHHSNLHFTRDTHLGARRALERAVTLEPEYAMGWAALGETVLDGHTMGLALTADREETVAETLEHTRRALELDRQCHYAHFVAAMAHLVNRNRRETIRRCEELLKPASDPSLRVFAGWHLALTGDWASGRKILDGFLREGSGGPGWLHHVPFLDAYRQRDFEAALESALRINMPNLLWDPLERAAAFAQLGKLDLARTALDELLTVQPDFALNPRRYLECFIFQDQLVDAVLEGLNKAGYQEPG